MTPKPTMSLRELQDLRNEVDSIRDRLMVYGIVSGERLYGIDEWSEPAVRLAKVIERIESLREVFQQLNPRHTFVTAAYASSTTPASDDATLAEGWHGAILDAGDIVANSTDQRIVSRASRIVTWLKAHKPATRAPASGEAFAWFSESVAESCWAEAFVERKPHDDGDWQPVYLAAQEGAQGERGVGNG